MTKGRRRWAVGGAIAALAAACLGAAVILRPAPGPPEAEGEAWLAAFADRLTSGQTWAARGPAALALFPGLGPWSTEGCVLHWSQQDSSAPVVTYQRLELGRYTAEEPCEQAQFGMLSATLRQSEGITPGALVARFTERFGPPDIHRDTALRGALRSTWQIQDGIFATVEERMQPGGADTFSVLFVRSYASPTALPSPADAERWMDRTVALVTGPELPAARGPTVPRLLEADMRPEGIGAATCPTIFEENRLDMSPIGSGRSLMLEVPRGEPCAAARFSWLSMRIWQREPVTAAALAHRIEARLGAPVLTRDFDRNAVAYRWPTPHGTVVELTEDMSATGRFWLSLRAWRPDA